MFINQPKRKKKKIIIYVFTIRVILFTIILIILLYIYCLPDSITIVPNVIEVFGQKLFLQKTNSFFIHNI